MSLSVIVQFPLLGNPTKVLYSGELVSTFRSTLAKVLYYCNLEISMSADLLILELWGSIGNKRSES
jgi:hypothetical protein